ncbi:MAG: CAP domain-containing protein [Neisseriaceae bacterium]|nr:CAP domain-containing protein [Neisseriaceae bacterium]
MKKYITCILSIIALSACSGLNIGIGTGFGGHHGGVGVSLGGTIPVGKNTPSQDTQIPAPLVQQELHIQWQKLNAMRQAQGLNSLIRNESLDAYAMMRANELAQNFSHTRPNGKDALSYIRNHSYTAENIAQTNNLSADEVLKQWQNSPSHLNNMMHRQIQSVGLGVYVDSSGRVYWVQIFGDIHSYARY